MIVTIETESGNRVDLVEKEEEISQVESPYWMFLSKVFPLQSRLKELGEEKVTKGNIKLFMAEGYIHKKGEPWWV